MPASIMASAPSRSPREKASYELRTAARFSVCADKKADSTFLCAPDQLSRPGLLLMSSELLTQGGEQLVGEVGLAARAEALVQRRREDVRGHALLDRGERRPAPLPRVRDAAGKAPDVGILLQRGSRQVEQPRLDHAA